MAAASTSQDARVVVRLAQSSHSRSCQRLRNRVYTTSLDHDHEALDYLLLLGEDRKVTQRLNDKRRDGDRSVLLKVGPVVDPFWGGYDQNSVLNDQEEGRETDRSGP